MSAKGLPSNSSEVATRFMSVIERASRKASRNLEVWRFRPARLISLMTRMVQVRTEASSRPTITTFTTGVALKNMPTRVMFAPPLMLVGAASAPPLFTAPLVSLLAVELSVVLLAAAAEAESSVFCAKRRGAHRHERQYAEHGEDRGRFLALQHLQPVPG